MGSHAEEAAAALQREKAELLEANRILRYSVKQYHVADDVQHATWRTTRNSARRRCDAVQRLVRHALWSGCIVVPSRGCATVRACHAGTIWLRCSSS
jgi:hypothetical protein